MELKPPTRAKGDSRSIWPLLVITLIASASAMLYLETGEEPLWECHALSTIEEPGATPPCFDATLSGINTVSIRWRVADPGSTVYILDDTSPNYDDPGYQATQCPEDKHNGCGIQVAVEQGGTYRWVIQVSDTHGKQTHASTNIFVHPLPPPEILAGGGFVDLLEPVKQLIKWQSPDTDATGSDGWVEIKEPNKLGWDDKRFPQRGAEAYLGVPASTFHSQGDFVFQLRDCLLPANSSGKFCSPAVDVGFKASYDHFTGRNNRHVPAGQDLEVTFTTRSGNARLLSSQSLLPPGQVLAIPAPEATLTIPGERLTPGAHQLELNSCRLPHAACSNRVNTPLAQTAGALWHQRPGYYNKGEEIARLYPLDSSDALLILAPASGPLHFHNPDLVSLVEEGDPIAFTITQAADVLRLLVDPPVEWTLDRPYTDDFHPGTAMATQGFGQALDITFDDDGGIWLLNEFSNSLEHLTPDGEITSFNLPLARSAQLSQTTIWPSEESREAHKAVKPFTYWKNTGGGIPTSFSTLAERIIAADSRIWLTQGGGLQPGTAGPWANRSRIISYDTRIKDSPSTPYDDRFCAYNMPVDDEFGYGNNQVIGLTLARGRVWVAESRGILSNETSYLSSFVPTPEYCENLMDFDDPQAHKLQRLQYCTEGHSPEQDGCVERTPMPASTKPLKIAHLQADPAGEFIWFTDASGRYMGRYDLSGESGVTLIAIDDVHEGEFESIAGLGGFPWAIQATDNAIYVAEYALRHILRFDMKSESYHEISVPFTGTGIRLHSLEVDSVRNRLWFSLSNECAVPERTARSTIGYVDLNSWQSYLEKGEKIQGVIYSGLETIPACDQHPGKHQAFRGIALDKRTGKIAIATMLREQITLLQPLPGFWP